MPAIPARFHNSFQDIGRFLAAGGRRGRQEQVLVDGTYFLNRLFATVEVTGKRRIEIGTVGVINSFVGRESDEAITAENGRGRTVGVGQPRHLARRRWSRANTRSTPTRHGGDRRTDHQLPVALDRRHGERRRACRTARAYDDRPEARFR